MLQSTYGYDKTKCVTSLKPGSNITITGGETGDLTIASSGGGGGGVTAVTAAAGSGINATTTSGSVALTNTGVLSIVAGSGITASSSTGNVTLTAAPSTKFVATVHNDGTYTSAGAGTFLKLTRGAASAPMVSGTDITWNSTTEQFDVAVAGTYMFNFTFSATNSSATTVNLAPTINSATGGLSNVGIGPSFDVPAYGGAGTTAFYVTTLPLNATVSLGHFGSSTSLFYKNIRVLITKLA